MLGYVLKKLMKGLFTILYTTTSRKIYPLELGYTIIPSNKIHVDKNLTQQACLNGCRLYGRNGGCPPFSPQFYDVCGIETLILYARLNTSDYFC
jgi:predicted metal-binding protein